MVIIYLFMVALYSWTRKISESAVTTVLMLNSPFSTTSHHFNRGTLGVGHWFSIINLPKRRLSSKTSPN